MVQETEECLVNAYKKKTYTMIREFTLFLDRLRHADLFLIVRMELLYVQLITSSNE